MAEAGLWQVLDGQCSEGVAGLHPVPVQVLGWLSQRAEGPPPEENSIKIAS